MRSLIPLLIISAVPITATADQFGCPHCHSCGRACVLKVAQVDSEEDCYEVECEEVCIPAVRFPWQSCHAPRCGRSRLVTKLKIESRPTKICEYEWVLACPKCGRIEFNGNRAAEENGIPPAPMDPMPPTPPAAPAAETGTAHLTTPSTPPLRSPRIVARPVLRHGTLR
jgi:hypothetical protein